MSSDQLPVAQTPATARQDFSGHEITTSGETAASAVEAHARAAVQSRYIMAMQRPRNIDQVRQDLLKECLRPGFARAAIYHKPIGRGITGPSIRFAEAALRCMKNIYIENPAVFEDDKKRIIKVSVTDLEANLYYSQDITIDKTVERNKIKTGQQIIATREGSRGQTVYVVSATDDELLNKQNAQISKAIRTLGLRLIPGDILDECMQVLYRTRDNETAADPDAAKKGVLDAFFKLSIRPTMIEQYLGHEVAIISPAEIELLRGIWASIRDGETTWTDVMESQGNAPEAKEEKPAGKPKAGVEGLKQKLAVEDKKPRDDTGIIADIIDGMEILGASDPAKEALEAAETFLERPVASLGDLSLPDLKKFHAHLQESFKS